ncbi:AAA family ATPase [Cesiribacter andamanensis]|uniref:Magnesium chelatase subunit D n=1 Tax=Cesiribacter andamanensis AMV16 TaxID=1279009 RepID=M7N5J0_9BACT|nr:MoxR family ATPase [Cesiribacter andamanensis]EMR02496.1 magnesium chelatase subunit D [Cesiribacter andamanensis AMV16]
MEDLENIETTPFASRLNLNDLQESMAAIRSQIGSVIVGQQEMVELLLVALLAEGHVLIEGVPGVAKTLTAKLLAAAIDTGFSRIQFTPDLMPSDILGTSVFNVKTSDFEFRQGPIFSNLVLIDEINRAPAKTQAALFEVMEERQITMDGQTRRMGEPFMVLATQNPIEQEGTYRLPEAQLDRFLFRIDVPYPELDEEVLILQGHHTKGKDFSGASIQPVLKPEQIARARALARQVHVSDDLLRYIARLVTTTRAYPDLYLGASPRASIAILASAKAYAALQGRDFITPEDVKRLAIPVLQHRVSLTPEREMEGRQEADILRELIETVEVPR